MAGTRVERFVYVTLVLGVVALIALALISEVRPPTIDPALAELVPADTILLAGVRGQALRATPIWRKWVAAKLADPGLARILNELARETGFDPRRDIAEVLFAWTGKYYVLLGRGNFRPAALEARLERDGGRRMPHPGGTLVGDEREATVFLGSSIAVNGSTPLVRSVLDRRGGPSAAPTVLLEQAKGIAADSQVWVVSAGGSDEVARALEREMKLRNLAGLGQFVERARLAADFRSGLDATVRMVCPSEQAARRLFDGVQDIIGEARLRTPANEPDLMRVCDSIEVNLEPRAVRLRARLAQQLMDRLLARL